MRLRSCGWHHKLEPPSIVAADTYDKSEYGTSRFFAFSVKRRRDRRLPSSSPLNFDLSDDARCEIVFHLHGGNRAVAQAVTTWRRGVLRTSPAA